LAILTVLFRWRWTIAVLLVLGSIAGGYAGFRHAVPPLGMLPLAGLSVLLTACVSLVHLRHAGLAALSALAPALGMMAASAVAHPLSTPGLLAVYGVGCIAASLTGGETVRRLLLDGTESAAKTALARNLLPCVLGTILGAAVAVAWLFRVSPGLALGAGSVLLASTAYGILAVAFGASLLPFGESFFTAANRVRERREALLRVTTRIVEPRWALSVSGIVLVFAVLGWFGVEPVFAHGAQIARPAYWGAAALGAFLLAFAVGRDWREGLAATLVLSVFMLLVLWLRGVVVGPLSEAMLVEITVPASAAYLPMLVLIGGWRRYHVSGDVSVVARARAQEDLGAAPYFAALSAAAATLPWATQHGSTGVLAVTFLLGGGAAAVAQPALATALEWLLPRRRSLNQLYGRG
jgi:hypothetical protein